MGAISDALRHDLTQPDFSEGYAEAFQDAYIATQIKVLREQNDWTQTQLAERLSTKQTVISRIENVNYSAWSLNIALYELKAGKIRLAPSIVPPPPKAPEGEDDTPENREFFKVVAKLYDRFLEDLNG
jgi:transcriptional regulator with XRE-family HTH domain